MIVRTDIFGQKPLTEILRPLYTTTPLFT